MPEKAVDVWECFPDAAYYDMWAVRKVESNDFGATFHVVTRQEAEALTAALNELTAERDKFERWYEERRGRVRELVEELDSNTIAFRKFEAENDRLWTIIESEQILREGGGGWA